MNNTLELASKDLEPTRSYAEQALSMEINEAKDIEEAGYLLKQLKDAKDKIEDQRVEFTKPLNDSLRSINAFFKNFSEPIEHADRELRNKIKDCTAKLRAVEDKPKDFASQSLETINRVGGVKMKKVKSFRVVDKSKIPLDYLEVNMVLIRKVIANFKDIPGIEIYEEEIPSL